ncbi:hypothetical protein EJ110_NYTH02322 [Nymphaea thermarum]|nr:hypothetical protein EJ110_NYTH02322 [Nymphaea thermarum]
MSTLLLECGLQGEGRGGERRQIGGRRGKGRWKFRVTAGMGLLSNKVQRSDLQTGDHVYSWRHAYIYAHHGIYTGDGKVIHFTRAADQEVGTGTFLDRILLSSSLSHTRNPCEKCGDLSAASGVIISCIDCFLSGGELYRFEYEVTPAFFIAKARGGTCTLAKSDTPEEVLHRATYLLQNGFGIYHIFKNNCEDFAIYCKTGLLVITSISVGRSGQAASFVAAATAVVSSPLRFMTTSFSGLAIVAGGMYCVSRYVADIGMRRDVEKIPVERLVARPNNDVEPEVPEQTLAEETRGAQLSSP